MEWIKFVEKKHEEQKAAVLDAVRVAKNRQAALMTKEILTRSEKFELEMIDHTIERGEDILSKMA